MQPSRCWKPFEPPIQRWRATRTNIRLSSARPSQMTSSTTVAAGNQTSTLLMSHTSRTAKPATIRSPRSRVTLHKESKISRTGSPARMARGTRQATSTRTSTTAFTKASPNSPSRMRYACSSTTLETSLSLSTARADLAANIQMGIRGLTPSHYHLTMTWRSCMP